MSAAQASISSASFAATIRPNFVQPASDIFSLKIPLNFSDVSEVNYYNGSFTPNNNAFYIIDLMIAEKAPNFMIVICDAQLNIYAHKKLTGYVLGGVQVMRYGFFSWFHDASDYLDTLFLDGRTASVGPMTQSVGVNYTIITGRGTIA